MRFYSAVMLVLVLSMCPVAHAQTPVTSLAGASAQLESGEPLIVVTQSGETVRGKFVSGSDAELRLEARSGGVRLPASDISRIVRPGDSLWNGALIGASVGVGFGLLAVVAQDGCGGLGPCLGAGQVGGTFGLVGLGAGALVDALIGRARVVYLRPSADAPGVRVAPTITRSGMGVAFSIRW
jgi:hypothetical protein